MALVALALKVLVPPGFMAAAPGSGFGLMICTGHGPAMVGGHDPAKPAGPSHEAPCAFAGHAATAAVAAPLPAGLVEFVAYAAAVPTALPRDLAPGRGLAAPPLPARGPPILLV
jgi:hypothetical protein